MMVGRLRKHSRNDGLPLQDINLPLGPRSITSQAVPVTRVARKRMYPFTA